MLPNEAPNGLGRKPFGTSWLVLNENRPDRAAAVGCWPPFLKLAHKLLYQRAPSLGVSSLDLGRLTWRPLSLSEQVSLSSKDAPNVGLILLSGVGYLRNTKCLT